VSEERDVDRDPLDLLGRVEAVARQVDSLRADLEAHRTAVRAELSTRRLVIRSPDGFPRIVLVAEGESGHVVLHARSTGPVTGAELFVHDASADGTASAGVALTDRGDVVASFDLVAEEGVDLWIDETSARDERA
jgi:hypothetical protein